MKDWALVLIAAAVAVAIVSIFVGAIILIFRGQSNTGTVEVAINGVFALAGALVGYLAGNRRDGD